MFVSLLLVVSFSCLVEGQSHPLSKTVIKTAPTFFAISSSNTGSGCLSESTTEIDQERRKTRKIINSNYKFRPHQCGGPGWTRVYYLNMSNPTSKCPTNLTLHNEVRACGRRNTDDPYSCDLLVIPVTNMKYSATCGRIYAYQYGRSEGFYDLFYTPDTDSYYIPGLSLTHGGPGIRHHIWSFVAADDETSSNTYHWSSCQCINTTNIRISKPPPFVGNDYFCDTGALTNSNNNYKVYKEDPLWDGEGCGGVSTCCSFNNPPWFYKELKYSTRDDLELNLCGFDHIQYENKLVYLVEIYIL